MHIFDAVYYNGPNHTVLGLRTHTSACFYFEVVDVDLINQLNLTMKDVSPFLLVDLIIWITIHKSRQQLTSIDIN